jgi:hypothetical protein
MNTMKIFIASPQDAQAEREAADTIIRKLSESGDMTCILEPVRWEMKIPAGFRREHIQTVIDREAGADQCDIVLVIFRQRIGTPLEPGEPTGTLHEFGLALKSWVAREQPWIMVYFDATPFHPENPHQMGQYNAVQSFKFSLADQKKDYREYEGLEDFKYKFRTHLPIVAKQVSEAVGTLFSKEKYESLVDTRDTFQSLLLHREKREKVVPGDLAKTGRSIYSSYSPEDPQHPFRQSSSNNDGRMGAARRR